MLPDLHILLFTHNQCIIIAAGLLLEWRRNDENGLRVRIRREPIFTSSFHHFRIKLIPKFVHTSFFPNRIDSFICCCSVIFFYTWCFYTDYPRKKSLTKLKITCCTFGPKLVCMCFFFVCWSKSIEKMKWKREKNKMRANKTNKQTKQIIYKWCLAFTFANLYSVHLGFCDA